MNGFSGIGNLFGASTLGGPQGGAPGTVGTQASVMGPSGKLEAFNPATMAGTYDAPTGPGPTYAGAGMDPSTGLPNYITNFLSSGGKGELKPPTLEITSGMVGPGSAALPPVEQIVPKKIGTGAMTGSGGYGGPMPAGSIGTPASASAPAATGAGMTMIPFNAPGGYNQPGLQQPMAVSDQWNMGTGSSQQIASPPVGGGMNAPQVMSGGIWMDGKGGFFSKDPAGKFVPMTGQNLTIAQNVAKGFGY